MIARTLRRSIRQLCTLDHRNEEQPLELWLANKKAAVVRTWLQNPNAELLVASVNGQIAGIGAFTYDGHVTLNYVNPDFRFCGVSKSLMAAIEERARTRTLRRLQLESTLTARRFYESIGYVASGPSQRKHGLDNQPMTKKI